MEAFLEFIREQIALIGDYPVWLYLSTGAVVLLITQGIKVPFKKYVSSKIENDATRRKVNLIFMVLPIALAIGINYGLSFLDFPFNVSAGISSGFLSEFLYEFIKTLIAKGKVTDETIEEATKEAEEKTEEMRTSLEEEERKLDNLLKNLK